MNDSTLNILCATDDNYVPYCGIMITSLFENNKDSKVCVYIMIDKPLSAKNTISFSRLAMTYGQQIELLMVDKSFLLNFPIKGMNYWSIATYYRLYAAELLPKFINRVLYLDCDIIITGSLASLWEIDMKDKACASVPDIFIFSDVCQRRLRYSVVDGYFNAGVLLMNLKYWRSNLIGQKCLCYLEDHYDLIEANDQDVLNAVLHDKNIALPLSYNYQIQFLSKYFYNLQNDEMRQQILEAYNNPRIIHFAYQIKPWNVLYYKRPFADVWMKYKDISLWKHTFPTFPQRKCFNWLVKRFIMWPLGLMKYDSGFIK